MKKKKYFEDMKITKPVVLGIIVFATMFIFSTLFFANRDISREKRIKNGDVIEITIPANYYTYIGSSAKDGANAYNAMGKDFCEEAYEQNGDLILLVTKKQRENLIKQNNEKIESFLKLYHKANKKYTFEDGDVLIYKYDEKLDDITERKAIVGVVSLYGLNYILKNNKTDWNINVEIYNCHNDKLIQKATAPNDAVMVKYDQWLESYKKEAK